MGVTVKLCHCVIVLIIRLAMKFGADLVPVYAFGQGDVYYTSRVLQQCVNHSACTHIVPHHIMSLPLALCPHTAGANSAATTSLSRRANTSHRCPRLVHQIPSMAEQTVQDRTAHFLGSLFRPDAAC